VKLTNAGHRFSVDAVAVKKKKPGKYDVKIDGQTVASHAAGQLAVGVELEGNEKTPEYQQALKVAMLNKQRNDQVMHPLRDLWGQRKGRIHNLNKAKNASAPNIEELQAAFDQSETEMKPKVDDLLGKAKQFEDQIYQANQPVSHHYEIAPAAK